MARGFHTIHNRLFLLFLTFMLSLLIILSVLYYKRTTDDFHAKIGSIAKNNVSQTVELFDLLLSGYDSLSKAISGNPDLQRLLLEPNKKDAAVQVINERTITNMLGTIYYSREDVKEIHVFTTSGSIYSYQNIMSTINLDYVNTDWFKRLIQSSGEMVWLGVKPESVIDPLLRQPVFAFGRQINDLYDQRPIGVVLIEVDSSAIMRVLSNLKLGPHSEAYVTTMQDNRVIAGSEADQPSGLNRYEDVPASLRSIPHPANDREVILDESKPNQLVVAAKPSMADWTIVSLTPNQDLNVELKETKRFLIIVVSILVVVSTLLATLVSRSIAAPLKRLIHGMKRVERGDFKELPNVRSYQEINILVGSFNQMVSRMDELIDRIKISSTSEKNAQLQALQSQVNPHFLYNTLDMIYWMLDEKENDRLGKVVLALSHMFRYSSHWEEGAEVTLREELEQIEHYLTIIQLRLGGRLQVDIQIEERWLSIRIPKMTLQPIIENAVKYGLERLDRPGLLSVRAEQSEGRLHVIIADNGNGMSEDQVQELEQSLHTEGSRRGIGLQNLQRRLALMFGEPFEVSIRSELDKGTTVVIPLPIPPQALQEGGGRPQR
ncbi:cache domain-containing sensor histidine kinase [Paenibacillus koleovorans]|uniref:cache domain-containing sensor histidine kinase n=1 Tax=Paenibacillus koleovorans TaxID=121608 RepID=UPI000FD6C385|nr:sensor histidine kinase [Paenibacillus koleovorans]